MGCVSSEAGSIPSRSAPTEVSRMAVSKYDRPPADDAELMRRNDEEKQEKLKMATAIKEMNKKLEEQAKQIQTLQKEKNLKEQEGKKILEEKETKIKALQTEKEKEVEALKKQLEKEKLKPKDPVPPKVLAPIKKGQETKPIGLESLQQYKSLCDECFFKLPRYVMANANMRECYTCRGYGLATDRFPYGANPSCEKSLCFSKGWDKVKSLRICTICQGKGGQELKIYGGKY